MPASPVSLMICGELASTRGPHSHGWASPIPGENRFAVYREGGPLVDSISVLLEWAHEYEVKSILGHSRLATTGTYAGGSPKIEDTMPFVSGDVAIVHNGNVRDYRLIAQQRRITLSTGCDSEIIAHLLREAWESIGRISLVEALKEAIPWFDDGRPFALIAISADGEIAAAHRHLPLYVANADEGMYFCSRRPPIEDATVVMSPPLWGWPAMKDAIDWKERQ